jgi:nicotinate-nucleotide--dimethylbenzimidazole phosphoribosyltransferase
MLEALDLAPVLDLAMRLGEGTGACMLMGLTEAAVRIFREMATFESAGVEKKLP